MIVLDERSSQLFPAVSSFAETVIFHRSKGFASDPIAAAEELFELLESKGHVGKAMYVAPSFAAFTGICVGAKYPGALSALLLLDPSHPRQSAVALNVLKTIPSSPQVDRLRVFFRGFGDVWDRACEDVSRIQNLGDLPITILGAGRHELLDGLPTELATRLIGDRAALLREYCRLSSTASLTIVDNAGHDVATDAPQEVLSVIQEFCDAQKPA